MQGNSVNEIAVMNCLATIANVQKELDAWSSRSRLESEVMYSHMMEYIQRVRAMVAGPEPLNRNRPPQTPPRMANPTTSSITGGAGGPVPTTPQRHGGGAANPTGATPITTPNRPGGSNVVPREPTPKRSPFTAEEEKKHDDESWNDITSHILREMGNSTPPPMGTPPDVTPTASPPCLEKRPISNIFGPGSTPINFELLFQQLSQDDGAVPTVREPQTPPLSGTNATTSWVVTTTPPSHNNSSSNMGGGGSDGMSSSRAVRPTIAMDAVLHLNGQHIMKHLVVQYADHGRPTVVRVDGVEESVIPPPLEQNTPCQVLVEFKRRRVLQYDSPIHIVPGEYAVVAGDRGEDLGLVIFSWYNTPHGVQASGLSGASVGKWIGLGIGKIVRVASAVEVSQVHGIQSELERCAVEMCQQRVREFNLPMTIVDAEYQFDRKKLTFYYEAQQRLDFRELVRDLYRTFRARIWMEMVEEK
eukprot:PhF_6_TR28291/c0_g1_i1/m.41896